MQIIANVQELQECAKGLRFDIIKNDEKIPAFAVRYDGQIFAYLNRCGHIAVQLDYNEGEFFSDDNTLICSTHGAEYAPETGQCLGGPCFGVGLQALDVCEVDGILYLKDDSYEVAKQDV